MITEINKKTYIKLDKLFDQPFDFANMKFELKCDDFDGKNGVYSENESIKHNGVWCLHGNDPRKARIKTDVKASKTNFEDIVVKLDTNTTKYKITWDCTQSPCQRKTQKIGNDELKTYSGQDLIDFFAKKD